MSVSKWTVMGRYDDLRRRVQALVPLAIATRPDPAATTALEELDASVCWRGFASFSHTLRSVQEAPPGWNGIRPADVHPAQPQAALRFLSCHRDGYVREAAVRSLDAGPAGIRWLLLRVNDWVPAVADLAVSKLVRRLTPESSSLWLPYLDLLAGFSRLSVAAIHDAIDAIAKGHPEVFEAYLGKPTALPANRRRAYEILRRQHPRRALTAAATSPDVALRALVLRSFSEADQLRGFLDDPVHSLRREAIDKLWEAGAWTEDVLRRGALDRTASVRETAKFYAGKAGQQALLASIYRHAPLSPARLEGAVGILPADELEPQLRELLCRPYCRLVRSAMLALDRLLPEAEELWWAMLRSDPQSRKRRQAGRLLKARRSFYLTGEQVWRAYEQASPPLRDEILGWAERSPCVHTRLRALYQRVLSEPDSLSPKAFRDRVATIRRQLPPYAYPADKLAVLQNLQRGWRESWHEFAPRW